MARTISGHSTVGVTLSSSSDNPVVVLRNASVDTTRPAAIYGTVGPAWVIQNDGALRGRLSGISLASGGSIANGTTNSAASIVGRLFGVAISGGAGAVANLGSISAVGLRGLGLVLGGGGSITNGSNADAAALISAAEEGVSVAGGLGTVVNYGTITSTGDRSTSVSLAAGGTVTNGSSADAVASILGRRYGVIVSGAAGAVTNYGTIQAAGVEGTGIQLSAGGSVTNARGASIGGIHYEIAITGNGAITNYGSIGGLKLRTSFGVNISGVGTVVNGSSIDRSALIGTGLHLDNGGSVYNAGTIRGLGVSGTVTVTNLGKLIHGTGFQGVFDVVNGSATDERALIADLAFHGIDLSGSGTLTNLARIESSLSSAVYADQSGGAITIVNGNHQDAAAQIKGDPYFQSYGVFLSLTSSAGTTASSIVNYGTISASDAIRLRGTAGLASIVNAGTIVGGKGGNAILATGVSTHLTVDPGAVFVGKVTVDTAAANTLELAAGQSSGTIVGLGTKFTGFAAVNVDPGATWALSGNAVGASTISIGASAVLDATGRLSVSAVKFLAGAVLELASPASATSVLSGFAAGDRIDLLGVVATGITLAAATDVLTVKGAGGTLASLRFSDAYAGQAFHFGADGHGGTTITLT